MKAIVLIKARTGEVKETVHFIRKLRSVREAYITFGPFDVIVTIETERLADIGEIVTGQIQTIPGVEQTLTCLAVDE